ncbi:GIY-YIG nuclease family protein [Nocardioides bizhenqiangii]|uniref:GIY-YIG nuclease family protein n=1 Tax=Nocardioides bizhenqiangii TaxID=3095076 RepID=A0ABZ0ZV70_9ACTN|nr:GIY-YIG nuclease family protein [Nocardioides sp. HM61]WQQ27721.1 GIY-YIG nuclease family protein [Nocardioides sp. HM61]
MPYLYILECSDGTYYTGSTFNLERRFVQHNEGTGARYTARRRPVRLIWFAEFASVRDAYLLEKKLQGWSHPKKKAFVEGRFGDLPELARCRTGPDLRT